MPRYYGRRNRRRKQVILRGRKRYSVRYPGSMFGIQGVPTRVLNPKISGIQIFKMKTCQQLTSDANDGLTFMVSLTKISSLLKHIGGSTYTPADWTQLLGMYDSYRVAGVKVQWYPLQKNNVLLDPNLTPAITDINRNNPAVCYVDYDYTIASAAVPVTTYATAVDYENSKVFDRMKNFKIYIRGRKVISTGSQIGWYDIAAEPDVGTINFYMPGSGASSTYASQTLGVVKVTAYVLLKNNI